MSTNGHKPSVMIGIPTNGDVKMLTVCSLVMGTNLLRSAGYDMQFVCREGPYTHWNREHLANDALSENADYLMFVDTDIVFPTEGIATLLGRGKDIIGGMYNLKQDERVTTIKLWDDERKGFRPVKDAPLPSGPFEVAALPTGFMLVHTRVFRGMEPPFFPCDFGLGEDVAFCVNAQKAGFEVWCDPTIPLQHIGLKAY